MRQGACRTCDPCRAGVHVGYWEGGGGPVLGEYDPRMYPDGCRYLIEAAADLTAAVLRDLNALANVGFGGVQRPHKALVDVRETWDETRLARCLPPARLDQYSPLFIRKFLVCIITVGAKLRSPHAEQLGCVAEEMAMYAILEEAIALSGLGDEGGATGQEVRLARRARKELESAEDLVFQDLDFLFLFDQAYEGIQGSPSGEALRMVSLDFSEWFKPFDDASWTHPYVETPERG